jgi:hypothetical protein
MEIYQNSIVKSILNIHKNDTLCYSEQIGFYDVANRYVIYYNFERINPLTAETINSFKFSNASSIVA